MRPDIQEERQKQMEKSALVVVDMVHDFTQPGGRVFYPQNEQVLPGINTAIDMARGAGAVIVFMQHRYRQGKYDKTLTTGMRPCCLEGSGGEALDERLHREPDDYVIPKRRYSAFYGTDLDLVLREHGVTQVVVVGTKTNCCIRATVNDAYHLAYNVVVVRQCVATDDDAVNAMHLTDIEKYLGRVVDLDALPAVLAEEKERS